MNEEAGFYKVEVGAKRSAMFFATHLENTDFILDKSLKDTYTYPVDGWRYFDTFTQACTFFNIDEEEFKEELFPDQEII